MRSELERWRLLLVKVAMNVGAPLTRPEPVGLRIRPEDVDHLRAVVRWIEGGRDGPTPMFHGESLEAWERDANF